MTAGVETDAQRGQVVQQGGDAGPQNSGQASCQEEGVQLQVIQKLNELDPSVRVFRTRQKIYLKKVKDDNK